MTKKDIAVIERIVRQNCYSENDPEESGFSSWLSVDQNQFLELIEHIPNREPCGPLRDPFAGIELHACASPGCGVRLGPGIGKYCFYHEA